MSGGELLRLCPCMSQCVCGYSEMSPSTTLTHSHLLKEPITAMIPSLLTPSSTSYCLLLSLSKTSVGHPSLFFMINPTH